MQRQVIRVVRRERIVARARPRHPEADLAAARLIALVNATRRDASVPILVADPDLSAAARVRVAEITSHFAHERPNGTLADLVHVVHGPWSTVGENLAWVVAPDAYSAVDRAHAGLLASPGHCANVLGPNFRAVGLGVDQRQKCWYFVQLFAG
jgi:uncharacterized protein YkwD